MMKGAQKRMIVLRTGGSRYFDEAYFVLKEGGRSGKRESRDMVCEATRILEENVMEEPKPRRGGRWLWFALGALAGMAAGGLLFWGLRLLPW